MDPRHHRDKHQRTSLPTQTANFRAQNSARAATLPVANMAMSRNTGFALVAPANPAAGFHQPSTHHNGGDGYGLPRVSLSGGKGGDGGPGGRQGSDGGDGMGVVVNMRATALTPEAANFFRAVFGADGQGGAGTGGNGGKGQVGGKGGRGMGQVFNVE
ncbi:hypothetical protein C8R45DRAFT_489750 [Mycena sanguinolenta]|nr:hypothetical protein C8R45DRAFT_489750 [Mycena sanguinolenta]